MVCGCTSSWMAFSHWKKSSSLLPWKRCFHFSLLMVMQNTAGACQVIVRWFDIISTDILTIRKIKQQQQNFDIRASFYFLSLEKVPCCLRTGPREQNGTRWGGWCYCGDEECTRISREGRSSQIGRHALTPKRAQQHFPRSDVEFGMRAGGAAAYGGRVCVNTVHIVCRCVVIRGGAPKEWGSHRSHDMSGMVTVLLFFLPFPVSWLSHV